MMKSLWSGVGGLQAHQIAMDVEGNNIANVNTTGFKYSRVNFADLLSQTSKIATSPQDPLGGKNGVQVGLGVTVATVSHIFSQGSIQNTDKNTDMAIQGDGFFIVSPDSGTTFKFTRAGDFTFDAYGNFVDANGYVVQGWTRNSETKRIDNTQPVKSIKVDPGLTTPASATTEISLKANLSASTTVSTTIPAYALDSDSATAASASISNGYVAQGSLVGNQEPLDIGVLFNAQGNAFNLQNGQGIWLSSQPTVIYTSASGAAHAFGKTGGDVDLILNGVHIKGSVTTSSLAVGSGGDAQTAANYASLINGYTAQTGVTAIVTNSGGNYYVEYKNNNDTEGDYTKNISLTVNAGNTFENTAITPSSGLAGSTTSAATAYKYVYSDTAVYLTKGGATADRLTVNPTTGGNAFHTTEDLRQLMQWQLGDSTSSTSSTGIKVSMNSAGEFEINNQNGINSLNIAITSIHNSAASSVTANKLFTATMQGLAGTSTKGVAATKTSLSLNAATHGSGIDVFDSLGSKHTISFTFVKVANGTSSSGPEWQWTATAPLPADLGGDQFSPNLYVGDSGQPNTIRFGQDGAILDYSPKKLNVSFNNGSAPNQTVSLNWGTSGAFDGLSSYDAASATSLISQDGYTGGDLQDIRIDQNGVLVGSFTNGISYGLAQVALAKFSNNEGLMAEGGNIYSMSSNSGAPTIGTASTGGRGAIASSALETSNVDLSRSLTELIVIQRGYQANSKTITTSDQMLQVLLSLKQ